MKPAANLPYIPVMCLILATLAVGCSPSSRVNIAVDAINDPDSRTGKKYFLVSGMKDVTVSNLYFKEYAHHVHQALARREFTRTTKPEQADVAISLVYGVGDPQSSFTTVTLPVFGITGGEQATFSATAWGGEEFTHVKGEVSTPVRLGVVGSKTVTSKTATYQSYVILYAIPLGSYRTSKVVSRVWQSMATTRNQSSDLRVLFPYLATAAIEFVGGNTRRRISVEIVKDRKGGLRVRKSSRCGEDIDRLTCKDIVARCGTPSPGSSWRWHIHHCKKSGKL